ncbi:AfsR/SARP family transcriptional regulator [Saccharothrix australiensis]|uniref:DNA-binding SARP family transcriptional activator n=1 Tax=Saccharothrix australiensis TaxID=2072 RepID=A0A495VYU9_9PSEU|nr:BTAD domain-containing putative transcriptional regulator [Saccharothrix australiensis]RKT54010.1 DNA-binding SARP family transcriptional activator [Saccharothrix australiensis]
MRFGVLGPLEVRDDRGRLLLPARRKERVLLAVLLLRDAPTSTDALTDALWDELPRSAAANLKTYLSDLRRLLRPDVAIDTRPDGYVLDVARADLDATHFEDLVEEGRQAARERRFDVATERFTRALGLWRGPVLDGLPVPALVHHRVTVLEELRLAVVEDNIDARLALGQDVAGELRALTDQHPLRERLWGQLMLALYRTGRQAEALAAYQRLRETLDAQLGIEPSPGLRRLHVEILRADRSLDRTPPPASAAIPRQLPAAVPSFTGRARALAELDRLADRARGDRSGTVVVISGTAGVGKTALAVRWADAARDRFPDGQLYADLRGYDALPPRRPLEVLSRFLHALGVPPERVPPDLDEAVALYRSTLADRSVLVVLDNAAAGDQVRPLLPGGSGGLVVVTSRDRLAGLVARDGAARIALDVLTPAESVDLLATLLGRERTAAEPDATAELADLCAHLPLALRITAAHFTGGRIADHVAELRRGNRLTALHADEDTAVRAAFDLSYSALPAPARRLFRLLGVIPGQDFTVDEAVAATGGAPPATEELLGTLTDAHLLHRDGDRYTTHDLLRLYARERARAEETPERRDRASHRLYAWYTAHAEAAAAVLYPDMARLPRPAPQPLFENEAQASAWLDAERANLVAAVLHAADAGGDLAEHAWLLADALRGYFWLRMATVDWLTVALAARRAAEGDPTARASAELSLGNLHFLLSEHARAIEHSTAALRLAEEGGWHAGQASAHNNLGGIHRQSGHLAEAAAHFARSLEIDRRHGLHAGQMASLNNLAIVAWQLGRLADSTEYFTQALRLRRQSQAPQGIALALGNLGELWHTRGEPDEALRHLTEALGIHREIGARVAEAGNLTTLAAIHNDLGDLPAAYEHARTSLMLARDTGERRIEAGALHVLGDIHRRAGQEADALDCYRQAALLAREADDDFLAAEALIGQGRAEEALAIARKAGYRVVEGKALTALARAELAAGNTAAADAHAREALEIHRSTGHRPGEAHTLLLLDRVAAARSEPDLAAAYRRAALELFTRMRSPEADALRDRV